MKAIKQKITLNVPANQATSKAPLGPTLGQYGIPIADFCKKFNEMSAIYKDATMIKVHATLYEDGDYKLELHLPDLNFFLKKSLNLAEASGTTGKYKLSENKKINFIISSIALFEICKTKSSTTEEELKIVYTKLLGTVKSMGIIVIPSYLLTE